MSCSRISTFIRNFAPHFVKKPQEASASKAKVIIYINHFKSMNQYETVFILTPVLSDEQMKETVAKFKKLLTDNGAEILNEEAWGLKKMAYAIEKKSTGFYCLLEFKAEPSVINTLETGYRRDEKVIRYMTVRLDKYAAQYAEKRRNKLGKKEEA
jgi:small subunit ribosomal protein S6